MTTDAAACARMFADFAPTVAPRAPVYARIAVGIAADEQIAGLLLHAPPEQRQPVLLLACIHDLLLRPDGGGDELARYYPNLTDPPDPGDPVPALTVFCRDHRAELVELLATRSTQTNEIGRCALLLPVFGVLAAEAGPLAHLDVGTSAGLNLLIDRYQYRYEPGGDVGPPSRVVLTCGVRGPVPVPSAIPEITARVGLDRSPVDVHDPEQRRWLEACIWPDQTDRFERLRAALDIAASIDIDVRTGDAVTDTPPIVEELATSSHPVVTNTWVLNYLRSDQRTSYLAALDELGSRMDLSWVFAESPALVPELPVPTTDPERSLTVVMLVRWRAGRRLVSHIANAHPHGYWLHWR